MTTRLTITCDMTMTPIRWCPICDSMLRYSYVAEAHICDMCILTENEAYAIAPPCDCPKCQREGERECQDNTQR